MGGVKFVGVVGVVGVGTLLEGKDEVKVGVGVGDG